MIDLLKLAKKYTINNFISMNVYFIRLNTLNRFLSIIFIKNFILIANNFFSYKHIFI